MSEWQPIETAPRMRVLLLFAVTDVGEDGSIKNWKMGTGSADHNGHWGWPDPLTAWDVMPTHWMPLPKPPENVP